MQARLESYGRFCFDCFGILFDPTQERVQASHAPLGATGAELSVDVDGGMSDIFKRGVCEISIALAGDDSGEALEGFVKK